MKNTISSDHHKGKVREKNEAKLLKFINDTKSNNQKGSNSIRKPQASQ
jgi:hypothetical protein